MSRWNRNNFIKKEVVDNIVQPDFVKNYFDVCFQLKRNVQYYEIEPADVQNPDLLSYKLYGVPDYWWIVCKLNNIFDVWNDLIVGNVITVPDIGDIEDFYSNVKKKQKDESK